MGLGRFGGGVAVARWLASRGAVVTVTDTADAASLAESIAALNNARIAAWHLGGHMEADFRDTDLVVVNPAVRPNNRYLQIAQDAKTPLTTEMELFLRACPAPVIGVTGANGKSTTAAMTAAILEADGHHVWLGGNLGGSLLDELDRISSHDWVVLELSSFQLCRLSTTTPMPRVAVVTNCTPNHLDWHGGYAKYVAAKQRILSGQTADAMAVLGESLVEDSTWRRQVRGRLLALLPKTDIPLLLIPGKHNRCNAVCAAAAAHGVGCGDEAIRRGLEGFSGLPGRLQLVATIEGRFFFNDTTATTPESTIAALNSLTSPIWLLAGGSDKGIDLSPMASAVVEKTRGAAFFGATAATLCPLTKAVSPAFSCVELVNLSEALHWCWRRSRPGDAIVLSPGCASHDQFQNFRRRGERFNELIHELPCLAERP
jgi:UDP-N-acetylmuramoylalanine--D-glutamate ligase